MPYSRYFAACLLVAAAILLTGALNSPTGRSAPAASPPGTSVTALKILDDATARLDPRRVCWLEAKVWQRGCLDRFTYESQGRYLLGPGHRLRLEITTRQGGTLAASLAICDGVTYWQGRRDAGAWTDMARVNLKEVFQSLQSTQSPLPIHDEVMQSFSFQGVVPLLETLRNRLSWTGKQTVRRDGRVLIRLTGSWSNETMRGLVRAGEMWPDGLPRRCRLYFEINTLWPHRVEWWGPLHAGAADTLLLQTEFRDPVINQPLSAECCARELAFPVNLDQAADRTPEVVERARQLLARQTPGRGE